jgi:F-type H+-transporting ATPase subunit delta
MHERARGYADAVLEDVGSDIGVVAGELEGFAALLASSGDLRGALANPAVSVLSRRTIVDELLSGRVPAAVVALARFAVQEGAAADYEADLAGIVAAAAARRDGLVALEEWQLGRTAATERLDGYATAVLAGLDHQRLGDVEDDLFRFMRTVEGDDGLRTALTTNELSAPVRQALVSDLLRDRTSPQVARLASYAARWGRPRDYPLLVQGLVERVARETDRRVADVRAAVEMSEDERSRLATALSHFTGSQVEVRVTAQPELLGGFVASVGDMVVDASLRHRLETARELLLAPSTLSAQAPQRRPDEH